MGYLKIKMITSQKTLRYIPLHYTKIKVFSGVLDNPCKQ